jgi:hypothetical protein
VLVTGPSTVPAGPSTIAVYGVHRADETNLASMNVTVSHTLSRGDTYSHQHAVPGALRPDPSLLNHPSRWEGTR